MERKGSGNSPRLVCMQSVSTKQRPASPHTDSCDDEGEEVDDGTENNEEESTYDSDYNFDDDSDGTEEDIQFLLLTVMLKDYN